MGKNGKIYEIKLSENTLPRPQNMNTDSQGDADFNLECPMGEILGDTL
jgi:hypothetical protein